MIRGTTLIYILHLRLNAAHAKPTQNTFSSDTHKGTSAKLNVQSLQPVTLLSKTRRLTYFSCSSCTQGHIQLKFIISQRT